MGLRGDEKHLVQVEGDAHGLPRLPERFCFMIAPSPLPVFGFQGFRRVYDSRNTRGGQHPAASVPDGPQAA